MDLLLVFMIGRQICFDGWLTRVSRIGGSKLLLWNSEVLSSVVREFRSFVLFSFSAHV